MRYALSLRARHDAMPAGLIIDAIGLPPRVHATAGQERHYTRTGKTGPRSRKTYAVFQLGKGSAEGLVPCMEQALEHLEARRSGLAPLTEAGVVLEFFVGVFLEGNEGIIFDPGLLRRLGAMEIELGLDIYGPDREQVSESALPPKGAESAASVGRADVEAPT
jgi:hypothetical protein